MKREHIIKRMDEIRLRLSKATPGGLAVCGPYPKVTVCYIDESKCDPEVGMFGEAFPIADFGETTDPKVSTHPDAELLAHAYEDLNFLLSLVEQNL